MFVSLSAASGSNDAASAARVTLVGAASPGALLADSLAEANDKAGSWTPGQWNAIADMVAQQEGDSLADAGKNVHRQNNTSPLPSWVSPPLASV